MKPRAALRLGWLLALVLLCASEGAAQQLSLSGTVRDTTGVVPGATVTLSSGGTQVATTTTDQSGAYRFTGLSAGSYEVAVSHAGLRDRSSATSRFGPDTPPVDVVLAVGRVSTSVTVTAAAGKATATRLPVPQRRRPGAGELDSAGTDRQQGSNTIGDALRNASGVQAIRWYGVVRAVHRFAASSIPIVTASTSCWWTACAAAATATPRRPTTSRRSRC